MTCRGQNVLAFVTTKGHLCGLDLRIPNLAWDLENDPRHGKSFCKMVLPTEIVCNIWDNKNDSFFITSDIHSNNKSKAILNTAFCSEQPFIHVALLGNVLCSFNNSMVIAEEIELTCF